MGQSLSADRDNRFDRYISNLLDLKGTSYWKLNCSQYITRAKGFRSCKAPQFFADGCDGALALVEERQSLRDIRTADLKAGDVLAFNGVHVAAYVGGGEFMDSDTNHGGVGKMTPYAIPNDPFFTGPVKVLRWKR
jgi:hypothetical protein